MPPQPAPYQNLPLHLSLKQFIINPQHFPEKKYKYFECLSQINVYNIDEVMYNLEQKTKG